MKLFLLAATLVYAAMACTILVMDPAVRLDNPWIIAIALNTCVAPAFATWAGAEMARSARRVRLFAHYGSPPALRIGAGLLAGGLGIVLIILSVTFLGDRLSDGWNPRSDIWITAPSALLSAALVVLPWPRVRRGRCHSCRYDLAALTPACKGLCPECGADLMRQV